MMASEIDDIVKVTITKSDASITRAGFGTLLIVGSSTVLTGETVKTYGSLDEVITDFNSSTNEYKSAVQAFSGDIKPERIMIGFWDSGNSQTISDAIGAIRAVNDDWYGVAFADDLAMADAEAVSATINSLDKILFLRSTESGIVDPSSTSDLAYKLQSSGQKRTILFYSTDVDDRIDAGVAGQLLPNQAGTITWAFKTINGSTAIAITTAQRDAIMGKGANLYHNVAGVNITQNGTTSSGEFIDVIRTIDYLKARIQENVYALLVSERKVPYTDKGVASVEGELMATLLLAEADGQLVDGSSRTVVPLVKDVSMIERTNRTLPDVKFYARLAGAIHRVEIDGTLSV